MWESDTVQVPAEVPLLQYKYLVMRGDRVLYWEGFPGNRRLECAELPRVGTTIIQDAWFCSNVLSRLYFRLRIVGYRSRSSSAMSS
jgi:hypothetical protein